MHPLPSSPKAAKLPRFAAFTIAAALMLAIPLHSSSASDALTTTTSSSSSTSTGSTKKSSLQNGILGLPIGIVKSLFSGASKVASKAVTKHVTKN